MHVEWNEAADEAVWFKGLHTKRVSNENVGRRQPRVAQGQERLQVKTKKFLGTNLNWYVTGVLDVKTNKLYGLWQIHKVFHHGMVTYRAYDYAPIRKLLDLYFKKFTKR